MSASKLTFTGTNLSRISAAIFGSEKSSLSTTLQTAHHPAQNSINIGLLRFRASAEAFWKSSFQGISDPLAGLDNRTVLGFEGMVATQHDSSAGFPASAFC